jgi:hypothetical protein
MRVRCKKIVPVCPIPKQIGQKLHVRVAQICSAYAHQLRQQYSGRWIGDVRVFLAAIAEMSRLGYIVLVDGKKNIPSWMSEEMVREIKRVKYEPIWMPTPKLHKIHVFDVLQPTIVRGKNIAWRHLPGNN